MQHDDERRFGCCRACLFWIIHFRPNFRHSIRHNACIYRRRETVLTRSDRMRSWQSRSGARFRSWPLAMVLNINASAAMKNAIFFFNVIFHPRFFSNLPQKEIAYQDRLNVFVFVHASFFSCTLNKLHSRLLLPSFSCWFSLLSFAISFSKSSALFSRTVFCHLVNNSIKQYKIITVFLSEVLMEVQRDLEHDGQHG